MSLSEAIVTGLQTTVVGLCTVFAVLIILMLVLKIFEKVFAGNSAKPKAAEVKKQSPAPAAPVPVQAAPVNNEEEELIAVLTAAIAASLDVPASKLKIKSYRRITDNAPAWNKAGVRETIEARF